MILVEISIFKGFFMWNLYKKYLVFAVVAFIALGIGIVNFKHAQPPEKNKSLVVGLQSGYPPFEFMDSKGQIIGFDVDVAKVIADKLDRQLVIKDMEFEGEILSLKQGKI